MKALRILIIEQFLKAGPETVESLAVKLKDKGIVCSSRSIYRDLLLLEENLRDPQMMVKRMDGEFNRGKWIICLRDHGRPDEVDTYLKTYMLDQFTPEWLKKVSGSALETLQQYNYKIPAKAIGSIMTEIPPEAVLHSNWCEFKYNSKTIAQIRQVFWAIANNKMVSIRYHLHGCWEQNLFRPFRIIYHRGTLHVAGWIVRSKSEIQFSVLDLEAFEKLELSNERLQLKFPLREAKQELHRRFGIHDSIEKKTEQIIIQMGEGPYLHLSNRFWHPSQRFYRDRKGHCFLELKCAVNIELIGWLFSWLEHVKVIKPVRLRKAMEERAVFMANMYRQNKQPVNPSDTNNPYLTGA
jgi:predicted DNA-binding transcriptional regulator YafY